MTVKLKNYVFMIENGINASIVFYRTFLQKRLCGSVSYRKKSNRKQFSKRVINRRMKIEVIIGGTYYTNSRMQIESKETRSVFRSSFPNRKTLNS